MKDLSKKAKHYIVHKGQFSNDYKVATPTKLYPTVTGIIMLSLKAIRQSHPNNKCLGSGHFRKRLLQKTLISENAHLSKSYLL